MSYRLTILDKNYNQALLALSKTRNTGSAMFNTDRSPDFFALAEELGAVTYFGILKNDRLVGVAGLARQTRIIRGKPTRTFYIFDLKVHPDWGGTPACYRLMQHVEAYCRDIEKAAWVFAIILDSNDNVRSLTRGGQLLPNGKVIGKNYHVGFPVFMPRKRKNILFAVQEIPSEVAWNFYLEHARSKSFAPAEKAVFMKKNGFFLGCYQQNKLAAVGKIIDQEPARKIYLTRPQPFSFRLLNLLCRYYGCPPLPRQGQVFHHGYLGYYMAANGLDLRQEFLTYVQQNHSGKFSYIFTGMTEPEARDHAGTFLIKFTSTTYGYGELPPGLELDAVELTLI